jgi:hypothetical protein
MEEFNYEGKWWLPDNPEDIQSGTISFNPDKDIVLALIGSFKDLKDAMTPLNPEIILGVTSDGKLMTLFKCYEIKTKFSIPGYGSATFLISIIFQGAHFKNKEDILFDNISINYSYLEQWVDKTGFRVSYEAEKVSGALKSYDVHYGYPEINNYKLKKFSLSTDFGFKSNFAFRGKINLEEVTYLKIEPFSKLHFDEYFENIIPHVQNFLSLGIGSAIYPQIIKCKNKNFFVSGKNKKIYNDIFIYYSITNKQEGSEKKIQSGMFFTFNDIKDNLGIYLSNWFEKFETLKPMYDLYFAVLYSPNLYINYKFLNFIQAIESYHRRIENGKYAKQEEFDLLVKTLVEAIPSSIVGDFKKSLKKRFQYLNEYSLLKRLKIILNKYSYLVNLFIKDRKIFMDDVVNTRNFLTHFDLKPKNKAKSGIELYKIVQRLRLLIELLFLVEIGIDSSQIEKIIKRSIQNKYFRTI